MAKIGATPLVKCVIQPVEGGGAPFKALFNPKEISWDKSISWEQHKDKKGNTNEEGLMEFTNAKPPSMSCEFFLDTYEQKTDVKLLLKPLEELTNVKSINNEQRPPIVLLVWGSFSFKGVIESLAIKYTMFLPTGIPCRATATVKLTEAPKAQKAAKKK